jgi:hypothetical protein
MAISMGVFSNLRYQTIAGVDRYLFDHSNHLFSYLMSSSVVRVASNWVGEPTRLALQGLPVDPPRRALAAGPARVRAAAGAASQRAPKKRPARSGKKARAQRKPKGFEMSAGLPS